MAGETPSTGMAGVRCGPTSTRTASIETFEDAAWRVVADLARTRKPVGILAWSGSHAQFVTGYVATGADPRVSDNFRVDAVYVTDPWEPDGIRNELVPYATWRNGPLDVRFAPYWQKDYTGRDPIDGQVGHVEWRGKYVIEEPLAEQFQPRASVSAATPMAMATTPDRWRTDSRSRKSKNAARAVMLAN